MTQAGADKELILGNKQLISLFFVVVALCGSFFAMGYMVGKSSGRPAGDATTLASTQTAPSTISPSPDIQRETPQPPADNPPPPAETTATETKPAETKPIETKPAPEPVTRPDPEPTRKTATPAMAEPKSTASTAVTTPETGASYLQVTALPRTDAESVVRTLKGQHFPAILASSSKEGLFRVLVGPFHKTAALAETKSRLKEIGFGGAFVQKQ